MAHENAQLCYQYADLGLGDQAKHNLSSKNFDSAHAFPVKPSDCCSKMSDGVSPRPRVNVLYHSESYNLLDYLMVPPAVVVEAGAGRDEVNHVSTRAYGTS